MFSHAIKLFSVSGFEIKVDPSWLLIATLITWSLAQHYFPLSLPGYSNGAYLLMGLIAMLFFFASLLLHELSHSVVARSNGVPIRGITLFLFGGMAELEAEPQSGRVEFWIAIAGPIMSFALSGLFWILSSLSQAVGASAALTEILSYLSLINLVLAIFNLVPAFPLDGGRILRAYLWHRHGDILRATETAARSGAIFAMILIGLGVLAIFQGAAAAGLWQVMIGLFVLTAARSSYQMQLAKSVFGDRTVGALVPGDPIILSPEMSIQEAVDDIFLPNRIGFAPVMEKGTLLGYLDQKAVAEIGRSDWGKTTVGDAYRGLDPAIMVSPDLPVEELMTRIAQSGRRKFLVVRDHDLLGVITLADITEYLHLAETLQRR
ncbi:MAG: site-2 protease family protein [Sulfitobacter sp.]|nr:site-2 protease family protein [Sulfitobacter sp.]